MSVIFHIKKIEHIEEDLVFVYTNIMDTNREFIFKLTRKKHKLLSEELIKYREFENILEKKAILNKYYFENSLNVINITNTLYNIKEEVVLFDPLELIYSSYTKNQYYAISMDDPKNNNYIQLSKFISTKICKNNFDKEYLKLYSRVIINLTKLAKHISEYNCNFHPDNFYINSKGQIKIANFENFINLYNSSNCSKWLKIQEKCKTIKKNQLLYNFLVKLIRQYYKNKKDTNYLFEYIQIYIELSKEDIDIYEIFDSDNVYDKIIETFRSLNKIPMEMLDIGNVKIGIDMLKKSDLEKKIDLLGKEKKEKLSRVIDYAKSYSSILSNFLNNIDKHLK